DTLSGAYGGNDTLLGESGDDTFRMFGALTALDHIDGGDGDDTLELNGPNYAAGLTFGATTAVNIEHITVKAGNDYNLTLNNAIGTGDLTVDGAGLGAGDTLRLNAAAETNNLSATGGLADDTLIGGAGPDTLVGGGGNDKLV